MRTCHALGMWPFRYQSLFRSRWAALVWAAGICWTAVEVAGWSGEKGADNAATANVSDADLARLQAQVAAFEAKQ